MSDISFTQALPYIAWLIALIELIIALYVLVLNAWNTANRHTSALILVVAANSFAIGSMLNATTVRSAELPAMVLAATTIAIEPLLLLNTIALLKPEWLSGRLKWIWWPFYALALLPVILTILDATLNTRLWYTGIPPLYSGGFIILDRFTQGSASAALQMVNYAILTALTAGILLYVALFNRKASRTNRKLAWMLLAVTLLAGFIQAVVARVIDPALATLLTSSIFAIAYSYACFSQMISERRMQRGSLQLRLTALILAVSVPLMVTITIFLTSSAARLIQQYTLTELRSTNKVISTRLSSWQDYQVKSLGWLVGNPAILSMDPAAQAPVVQSMAAAFPELSLISIVDLEGNSIARSDGGNPRNYSQLSWFQEAKSGQQFVYRSQLDDRTGNLVQVIATPVIDANGEIVGVGMFSTYPGTLDGLLQDAAIGETLSVFVLNENNQVIASNPPTPNSTLNAGLYSTISALRDRNPGAAVQASEDDLPGPLLVRDSQGVEWRAGFQLLENGWAVVMLTPEPALLAGLHFFQRVSWLALLVGASLLLVLSWLTIRQAIQPVHALTETATAIANGDLTRVAMVETDDEIGALARTFNSMTSQLRELIANLEHRVSDRTRDIERRAVQIQVAAEVSREAAAIQEQEQLLDHTVHLISQRFNFYHAGIFLIDSAGKFAVLRAASSDGGQRMLARGHQLEVGRVGIVGFVAASGAARVAHDVGSDAVFFNNPDLPQTRSELALPLNARGKIIGVLDVQSTKPAAFSEGDVTTLQILADQVALAIDNTRLMSEANQALQELRNLYAMQVGEAWRKRLGDRKITYAYGRHAERDLTQSGSPQRPNPEEPATLRVPIIFRGHPLGSITLKKEGELARWTHDEIQVVHTIVTQFSLALENARLIEETQRRAERERRISEITARIRSSNDPQVILQTAAAELSNALQVTRSQIIINPAPEFAPTSAGGNGHKTPASASSPGEELDPSQTTPVAQVTK